MRLMEQMMKTVTVKPAAAPEIYQDDDRQYRFAQSGAFAIRVTLQPMAEKQDRDVYGQTPQATLLMLYQGSEALHEGMGVCVNANPDAPCDYRIAEMPRWYQGHAEIVLAFIPESLRAKAAE